MIGHTIHVSACIPSITFRASKSSKSSKLSAQLLSGRVPLGNKRTAYCSKNCTRDWAAVASVARDGGVGVWGFSVGTYEPV